jgi:hypothetical protein
MKRLIGFALAILFAVGAHAATRAELEAQAEALRAQIVSLKAQADDMIAQRLRILEQVAVLEVKATALDEQISAMSANVLRYWYTSDDGDGPSRSHWSRHLKIAWKNANGDFIDAAGTPQGAVPFAKVDISAVGPVSIHLGPAQPFTKGILLRNAGKSSPYVTIAGRLSATPPTLTVKLSDGSEKTLQVLSLAKWDTSSYTGMDTRQSAKLSAVSAGVLALFDIPPGAVSATLNLTITARTYTSTVSVFALDPPGVMYAYEHKPVPGIAQSVADENALKFHPSVIKAGDFDLRRPASEGGVFTGIQQSPNVTKEYLPDPLDPTRIIYRSMFKQRDGTAYADQNWRGSLSANISMSPADLTDPLRPIKEPAPKELFARLCFKMEADWLARNDANKMALGWDLRYGYWMPSGYWQQTTGNGGARGTGLKVLRTNKNGTQQWEYQGHSIRMEAGMAPKDPTHPHDALRPITSYTYHLDQFDFNGTGERWGNAVIERARWHCIEQQLRVNSVVGPFDALGNGQAVADGVMRTWIDGVFVGERTSMRWGRHQSMGVEGPWINWFFGGKQAADHEMHYQMADFVLAREYIGVPNNFHMRNK